MYLITNGYFNHDGAIVYEYLRDAHMERGRWFSIVPDMLLGNYNLKWLNSLFALIYLSAATSLIGVCLGLKRTPLILLLSGLIMSFPAVGLTFAYVYYVDNFFLAILLACLAVYFVKTFRFGFLFGAVPLFLSVAIYQAYIGVYAGLFVIILIKELLDGQDQKPVISRFFKYVIAFIIAMVAYFVSLIPVSGKMTSYAGISSMGGLSAENLPGRFLSSYTDILNIFFRNSYQIHHGFHIDRFTPISIYQYLFLAAFGISLALLIIIIIGRKLYSKRAPFVLMLAFLAIFPPACNLVTIVSAEHLYLLMQFSLILIYALMLVLVDVAAVVAEKGLPGLRRKITYPASWALMLFFCVLILNYTVYSNVYYLKMEIIMEQSRALSTEVVTRIRMEDFYAVEKTVMFWGVPPMNSSLYQFIDMEAMPLGNIMQMYSLQPFLYNYIGFNNTTMYYGYDLPQDIVESPEAFELVDRMPVFPADGSIVEFRDYIFVRFAGWY